MIYRLAWVELLGCALLLAVATPALWLKARRDTSLGLFRRLLTYAAPVFAVPIAWFAVTTAAHPETLGGDSALDGRLLVLALATPLLPIALYLTARASFRALRAEHEGPQGR